MSDERFSPGPWKAVGNGIVAKGKGYIAKALEIFMAGKEREANARLIAAAPELYEALVDAVCALEICEKDFDYVIGKAKAAISKAKDG